MTRCSATVPNMGIYVGKREAEGNTGDRPWVGTARNAGSFQTVGGPPGRITGSGYTRLVFRFMKSIRMYCPNVIVFVK